MGDILVIYVIRINLLLESADVGYVTASNGVLMKARSPTDADYLK